MGKSAIQPLVLGGVVHVLAVNSLTDIEKLRVQAKDRPAELRVEVTSGELKGIGVTDCAEFDGEQDRLGLDYREIEPGPTRGCWPKVPGTVFRFAIPACAEWSLWLAGTATVKVNGRLLD